jgi:hypothetical protein
MTLSQLSAGLLFLHGHIADPALAKTLAAGGERPSTPTPRRPAMDLFKSLMYLGGRPMHPGHNYDLEEPFEPTFGNRVATERLFGRTPPHDAAQRLPVPQAADACLQGCG